MAFQKTDPVELAQRFPADFTFGVATAAYQIEGAVHEDGRGPSIWDAFSHMPGRVHQGDTGNVACDHYHRWEADLDLMASLNVDAYRFSIAWPRIQPMGRGAVNQPGLDFYDRLVDGILARGMKVFPTLYHWDLPLALMAQGGWTDRNTADAFADYTSIIVKALGDRIDALCTFNEPWCSVYHGHLYGKHAPGEQSLEAALAAAHVTNLAHGKSVIAARAEQPNIAMGIVLNAVSTYAASDSAEDQAAAERSFQFDNGVFFAPIFSGEYESEFRSALGEHLNVKDGDLETICQPLDWWGFNYYFPNTVRHDSAPDAQFPAVIAVASTNSNVRTDIGWEIKAEGMGHLLRQVYDRYQGLPPCYITENGASYNMGPGENGEVDDQPRLDYLAEHLHELADVTAAGIPMKGYFAWSLMDNYEWAEGYKMRFGIVHVDYDTQVRTVKKSGHWYAAMNRAHKEMSA
ncbi:MAG: GH1 family beta-glucosidase [Pseudomonadota bacterium]